MVEWGSQGVMQYALGSVHQALGSGTGIEDLFSSESGHAAVYIQHTCIGYWVHDAVCTGYWALSTGHWVVVLALRTWSAHSPGTGVGMLPLLLPLNPTKCHTKFTLL